MDSPSTHFEPKATDCSSANQKYAPTFLSAAEKEDGPCCQPSRQEGTSTSYWQRALEQLVRVLETTPFLFLETSHRAPWVPQVSECLKKASDSQKIFPSSDESKTHPSNLDCKSQASSCFNSSIQAPSDPAARSKEDSGGNTPLDVAASVCRVCHCEIAASELFVLDCGCHGKGLAVMHSECAVLWFSYQETR